MSNVKDSVCIVTGGGSGIGRAICMALGKGGAVGISVVDINLKSAEATAKSVSSEFGCECIALGANCGKESEVRRVINTSWAAFGKVDVYVSNAGILINGGIDTPNDDWARILDVNVMTHIYAAKHLFPLWAKHSIKSPRFVVTSSAAGLTTMIGSLPYAVTKHAALSVAEWLAISHGGEQHGAVKVHCLCPMAVRTKMLPDNDQDAGPAGLDGILSPEDVAHQLVAAMEHDKFLVLPHERVAKYMKYKALDYDRWIHNNRQLHKNMDNS
eukprot:CAMPEP_0185725390 /NCGR_PEP_ID=MMETSP1171-20130828/1662_1 /TAXON_ID=374046 /ORGANISM="Helicotheca tamensis, Strain CCMP826" /LENGTH=269 /DNA_ID=CAMNT_0028393507 /DNA_START=37 /DNA_END=847 /DNA_ORIENTATION=+